MNNTVLIVEDNTVNRNILKKILLDEYTIMEASDGLEALDIIKKNHDNISAIILDLLMPNMDGRELMQIITKDDKYSNLPILIATGEHNSVLESECLEMGAWDFVTKPYSPIVIKLRLRNIIGRSQTYLMNRVQTLAQRDTLTGLYNRQYFMKSTAQMLRDNTDETYVLVRVDIDHFRLYNSSFGSKAGDTLLVNIANGIKLITAQRVKGAATYGRIESDVFCLCLPYHKKPLEDALIEVEHDIQGLCSTYRLKVSFGLYVIDDRNIELETMYAHSVEAAKLCKNNLNVLFGYYGKEMGEKAQKALLLTNEMARAIEEKQFKVYLQPKYSLTTNSPCGSEALVRWIHPEWGMVSPGEFIPVFEQNGLIVQLDYYMWENVCILIKKWIDEERKLYPVSVNISRISMYNPQIVNELTELTDRYKIPRKLLNLEITESAYMSNPNLMKSIIAELREKGFIILMDDFGSGYSSLNTLKDIDMDILKIDMKFLPTGHDNVKSEKILVSITRMAGWLGMPVIVEGVETKEQRDFLESIGCEYVQGFYYARPMPVDEYEKLIENQNAVTDNDDTLSEEKLLGNFDAIWSSDSGSGTLLKSISVPFAILEYTDSHTDIVRMNKVYTQEIGYKTLEDCLMHHEIYKLYSSIDEAVMSKGSSECECLFMLDSGSKWYHIKLMYIAMVNKSALISASFSDVSSERMLEKELGVIFGALKDRTGGRGCLLVIDDMDISIEIIKGIFADEYDIIAAADGQEGLRLLEQNSDRISAILLDMMMPHMDGHEFLLYKNKMEDAADIPVVVISADDTENTQVNMLENGVNDYVTKPFVPALVKKRIHNVIEYSSRFRALVQEFHNANSFSDSKGNQINLTGYSTNEVRNMIRFMSEIFDLVRLVDPQTTSVVTILGDGTVKRVPYSCFSIWGRSVRCENCSSMCALHGQCTVNKFELLKKDVFYVVSQPVEIFLDGEASEKLVLEVASKISDETDSGMESAQQIYNRMQNTHRMIYMDPLTGAYNRRFLDEMHFAYHGQNGMADRVAFIMMDLFRFKQINDVFGHQTGDKVLKSVAEALKRQIRPSDSVVRFGGDEFIIILTNCDKELVPKTIKRLKRAVNRVMYGPSDSVAADADFGYSYSSSYSNDQIIVNNLIKESDKMMYTNKKNHREKDKTD